VWSVVTGEAEHVMKGHEEDVHIIHSLHTNSQHDELYILTVNPGPGARVVDTDRGSRARDEGPRGGCARLLHLGRRPPRRHVQLRQVRKLLRP